MRFLFAAGFASVLLNGMVACADDWPEFRGPTGQGHAKGTFPTQWGPDKNIGWKQDIPGLGWSSPVLWKGRIYLTTAVPAKVTAKEDLSLRALCLDAKTGKILWDIEVIRQPGKKVPPPAPFNSNASPTPIVDGERLYVHFGHLGTACLDLEGKILWQNTELRYEPYHGNAGSPILVDDLLVFSAYGTDKQFVVALERATGKVKWKTDRKSRAVSFSTPLLIEANGRRQIISPASDMVFAYDPKTGEEIWRVRSSGNTVIPRPVYGHGLVFVATSFHTPTMFVIRPDGQGDVTDTHIAWIAKKGAPNVPSPLLAGNELYVVSRNGTLSCFDAKTGKVHWSERLEGDFFASPILADGKIYFQNEDGKGFVVRASTRYELLARNDMKEQTYASYAAADGAIFLRTAQHLYRIEQRR